MSSTYLNILLDKKHIGLSSSSESLLFAAARAQLTIEKIQPAFEYIKLGPLDIPILFVRRITNARLIVTPTPGWPLTTNIKSLNIYPRKIEIN